MKRKETFTRELFILFYLLFFCSTFLYKLTQISVLRYLVTIARYTYIPGMMFAAGYEINTLNHWYPDLKDFRSRVLKKASHWMMHFYLIGFLKELILDRRDPLPTIKDLLALIRIPGLTAIFVSLAILYVMAAFLWRPVMNHLGKKWVLPVVSIAGFLCTFIPEGLIGYGLVGIFTGADIVGAVPIFPYLFLIFLGAGFATEDEFRFYEKKYMLVSILILLFAGVMILLHLKEPALTIVGGFLAWVGVFFCSILQGVYGKVEEGAAAFWQRRKSHLITFYEGKQDRKVWRGLFYLLGYTAVFAVLSFFIFVPYLRDHRTLIWYVDGLGQYVPKIYRFMETIPGVLKDILHGNMNFKQYDFSSGLGSTIAISYDPIYWLYLLFHPSQVETVYSAMIILRYFLAGLSFSAMVLFFGGSHFAAYTTSMVYAYSGYALYAGTKHGQFLTPLILLPLLVIAMERLIRDKKWYMMTILVALSLLCSYYFLWMNTIAIGIYFVVRILCTEEYRNLVTFFTRGLIIVGSYILGAGIGIISIFTSFASYMGSSRTEGGSLDSFLSTTPLFYRPEWISDSFISYISDSFTPGMWLKLGFAPIALLAVVLLFTRKARKELRALFWIFTLFCIFPACGFIFSGFSSVNNRWCYIYACLIAFILAQTLEKLPKLTAAELRIMTGLTFLYGGIVYFSTKYHTDKVFGAFGLLTMTLIVLYLINQKPLTFSGSAINRFLLGITLVTILFNANMFITAGSDTGTHLETYVESGSSRKKMTTSALKYLDQAAGDEEEFYRATNLKTTGNERSGSLLLGYNDISTFTSTLGSGIVDYNSAMGNCDWNIVSVYSYNARTILNELASVKYLATDSKRKTCIPYGYHQVYEKKGKKSSKYIYENEYALPLGYTYDNILSQEEASKYSAVEKQDLTMMTAIVNQDAKVDNSNLDSEKKLQLSAHEIKITDMDLDGVTVDEKEGILQVEQGGSITFHFKGEKNCETYLGFTGDIYHEKDAKEHFLKTNIKADGTAYLYKFRIDSYSTGQREFLFHLGYHEEAIDSCKLEFTAAGMLRYDDIAIYVQPMDRYPAQVASLKKNVLKHVVTDTNRVTGDISLDTDKMLCITLPCQAGWTAYVDGEKTPIQRINYQYMGLNLTAGDHQIELRYQLPGIRYAFLITGAAIAVFVLIILINLLRKRRDKNHKEVTGKHMEK